MSRKMLTGLAAVAAALLASAAQAQQPPQITTTKVEGTDNVYIFRYGGAQSMFIVTPQGVIATDPISPRRSAQPYIDEIRKITQAPIKYMIYSHSHYDHIAGGKPFKDLKATFVAHRNAKARLQQLKPADIVIPDQVVDKQTNIKLGNTTLELNWVGRNHSDNMLVMRLPKEKIIFTVDWVPIEGVQFRGMADTYVPEIEDSMKRVIAMDWERLIPGHPSMRLGTKDDARADLQYLQDLSAAVKEQVDMGKNYGDAQAAVKLPKYEKWGGYANFLPMNVERYYDFWNRGI
jgi:glyoxylase-like metal-dependent hydrolase (beta-lactamase superfamily II)